MSKKASTFSVAHLALWWFPLLVATIIGIGSAVVLIPQSMQLLENKQNLDKADATLKKAQTKLTQVEALNEEKLDQNLRLVSLALPVDKPYYEVFATLLKLSKETGVVLGSFDLTPGSLATASASTKSTNKEGYSALDTSISISGLTTQITEFINKMQQSIPLFGLKSISIGQDRDQLGRNAELEIEIYYSSIQRSVKKEITYEPIKMLTTEQESLLTSLAQYESANNVRTDSFSNLERVDIFTY